MAEDIIKENEVEYEDPLMKDEIGSEDEEKILDSWRNRGESYDIPQDVNNPQAKWAHQVKQPWHYNNVRIYQKQLNSYTKSRENIKDVFSRHNSWLNNMKDELNRAVATPVKSNMSKYLV